MQALWAALMVASLIANIVQSREISKIVYDGNNQFAFDLYKTLSQEEGNVVYSPFSAYAALSMIYQGSHGTTQAKMDNILHFSDKITQANAYEEALSHLNNAEGVSIVIANKIFVQKDCQLKNAYERSLHDSYHSDKELLDFSQASEAAEAINSWIENKTHHKIKDLFTPEDFDEDTRLVAANSLYFKGQWDIPFFERATTVKEFHVNDEKTVDVKVMREDNLFKVKFFQDLDANVLEMPFTNQEFSMIVILPTLMNGISQLESKLATIDLNEIVNNLNYQFAYVQLPKFKVQQTIDLGKILKEMGLGELFGDDCDLSEMIDNQQLFVSKAIQKVFINVDEKGCEATASSGMKTSARTRNFSFIADHPFVFAIIEKENGNVNVLFAGRVSDPST